MSTNIQNLISVWAERPPRVEHDDIEHLTYIFTRLLPALRDSMLDIEQLTSQAPPPVEDSPLPNSAPSPEPSPAPSNHIPEGSLSRVGTAAASGQTRDTADTVLSSPATVEPPVGNWRETTGHAEPG